MEYIDILDIIYEIVDLEEELDNLEHEIEVALWEEYLADYEEPSLYVYELFSRVDEINKELFALKTTVNNTMVWDAYYEHLDNKLLGYA